MLSPYRSVQVELEQAFKLFDADQSGYVTADEIRSLMTGAGGDEVRGLALRVGWEAADRTWDADKGVGWEGRGTAAPRTCGPYTARPCASWQALTPAEVEELIKMADPDRDGKISFDEFKDMECWKIPEPDTAQMRQRAAAAASAAPPAS